MIALILIATAGSGVRSIVIAIGVAFTPGFARVVEASVRKLRTVDYVEAARVFGSSRSRTSVRHLLPNLMTEVVVLGTSAIGWAVLTATTLSFLGLGVQLPAAGLGQRPRRGRDLPVHLLVAVDVPRPRHHRHDPAGQLHRRLADDRARPARRRAAHPGLPRAACSASAARHGLAGLAAARAAADGRQPATDRPSDRGEGGPVSLLEITGLRTEIATREGRVRAVDGVIAHRRGGRGRRPGRRVGLAARR